MYVLWYSPSNFIFFLVMKYMISDNLVDKLDLEPIAYFYTDI